jgi:hypothetical protein
MAAAVSLAIATPCFGGQLSVLYAESMFKLQQFVRNKGIDLRVFLKDGDALITRARASLASQFLDDPTATHLLFIDADIGFDAAQVLRLIECGAEMCAAIYPIKLINWDKVREALQAGRSNPEAASMNYVFEVQDPNSVIARAGFIRVRYAGTGFLMIRREALQRMCTQYPHLQYRQDHSLEAKMPSNNRYALFDCMIDETGTYLSEDFSFCRRWTDMGGEIWADLNSALNHVGPRIFRGDLSSQFGPAQTAPTARTPAAAE